MKTRILSLTLFAFLWACNGNNNHSDAYGNFEAKEVIVSAEMTGKILKFTAEEGQKLQKGQVLGFIDTVPLSIQREQAVARKYAVASKRDHIKAQVQVLHEQMAVLQTELKRIEKLYTDNAATKQQFDEVKGKVDILEKQIEAANTQTVSVLREMDVIDKQIKLLNEQISRSIIKNPVQGVILEKYLEENEIAVAGKAMYKVAKLDEIELRVYISGAGLADIKLGQAVKVFVDKDIESKYEYRGEVSWISDQAEFTPKIIQTKEERVNMVYAVKIRVKNDGKLKIGMPGEIVFEYE